MQFDCKVLSLTTPRLSCNIQYFLIITYRDLILILSLQILFCSMFQPNRHVFSVDWFFFMLVVFALCYCTEGVRNLDIQYVCYTADKSRGLKQRREDFPVCYLRLSESNHATIPGDMSFYQVFGVAQSCPGRTLLSLLQP